MTLKNDELRKVPMSRVACKKLNLDWCVAYAEATGQSASAVVDMALDDARKKYDIETDMEQAEERLIEGLISLWDYQEKIKQSYSEEEAVARRKIRAYLTEIRAGKDFRRNLITSEEFNKMLNAWLLENVCKVSGIRIEKATRIARSIWVFLELEDKGGKESEPI